MRRPLAYTRGSADTRGSAEARGSAAVVDARVCKARDLGRISFGAAFAIQQELVEQRKKGLIADQLLFLEHPHVITLGRNAHRENLLAGAESVELHETNRGGDVTYHGPGQVVGYPILDLREWKRDVVAYVRGLEQVIIDALAEFRIAGERLSGCTGVWVEGSKIAAIGVHISRWVTSHGFALNVDTDLRYFQYIVPCGLTRPVTSLRELGSPAQRVEVVDALARQFSRIFNSQIEWSGSYD